MTLAELIRAIESKKRVQELEAKQRAVFDYKLADLIGRSISRIYFTRAKIPDISEVYPSLFDKEEAEEARQQKQVQSFAERLKLYSQIHNKKLREESKPNE